jgi:nucleotide-binding universal stress UspA family protein
MIKILCPTDFSPNSEFAVEYAINLANDLKAEICFISSYKVPHTPGALRNLNEKIHEAMWEDLKYFLNKFKSLVKTGIEPTLAVVEGNTSSSILNYAKNHNIDLIIMGTKGSSGLANMLMGSITKKFFESSNIPVLAIPHSLKYHVTRNTILLALDARGINNEDSISLLRKLKQVPDAQVDVFHVITPNEKVKLSENTGKIADIVRNIVVVEGEDIVYEIKKYVDENEIGILVMVGRKHSFLEKLFKETTTSAELFATNVPMLKMPEED